MTALTIVQDVCSRLGIAQPTAVFSSQDQQIIQLRTLMNQEGQELARGVNFEHAWTKLITEKTFTTVAAAIQTSAVPTDFGWYINESLWNRTTMRKLLGPVTAEQWQAQQALNTGAVPDAWFRFRGGNLLIYPSPTAGQTAAYEYVSSYWCQNSGGSSQASMSADSDTAILDETLITLGVEWRFLKQKGLDYAESFRTYQIEVNKAIARDGGRPRLSMSRPVVPRFNGNIPESGWSL